MVHLKVIKTTDDPWCLLIQDDPVRPEIAIEDRIGDFAEILVSIGEQDEPRAVVCIRYCGSIPGSVEDLMVDTGGNVAAVFYSIWSYSSGAGSEMIALARRYVESTRPQIGEFVTLSPRTEMARRFHLKNGAQIYRENQGTVNFRYP